MVGECSPLHATGHRFRDGLRTVLAHLLFTCFAAAPQAEWLLTAVEETGNGFREHFAGAAAERRALRPARGLVTDPECCRGVAGLTRAARGT